MCNHPTCENGVCRREQKQVKRVPLPKVSKKEAQRKRKYLKLKNKIMETRQVCEMQIVPECQYWGTQLHHPEGRIGERLIDEKELIVACYPCHHYVETHPTEAKEKGFSKSRLSKD